MSPSDTHGLGPLLERSRAGDGAARGALLGHLRPYLQALIRSWLGHELARQLDDSSIAQESLLRIEHGWDGFRGQTVPQLLAWARRISHNLAIDRIRRLQGGAAAAGDALAAVPAPGPEPLDVLVHEEDAARLAMALERLPPPRCDVIVARLLDGLPFETVALRLGKTSGAVRVLFKRAVEQLRHLLEDEP
jgi:RNA polymerase sigma-70 factor (ECF subfamily)